MNKLSSIIFLVTFTLFLNVSAPFAIADSNLNILNSTCRIRGNGSGVAFLDDPKTIFILTAGHVVLDNAGIPEKGMYVEFYRDKKKSHKIPAEIVWHAYQAETTKDLSVIKVKKEDFKDYPLPYIMGIGETDLKVGDKFLSCGYPTKDTMSSFLVGTIIKTQSDHIQLSSKALPGRSGSLVTDEAGTKIYGIIIWQNGVSVSLNKIQESLK